MTSFRLRSRARLHHAAVLTATALALLGCSEPQATQTPQLTLTDCRISGFGGFAKVKAECGELAVPLDYADPDKGSVSLFVARVPALARSSAPSAFTVIAGGPGQASTQAYASLRGAFERVRRERDIILVDQRGTGQSNLQQCETPTEDYDTASYDPALVRALAESCLADLGDDVRYYTTSAAVRDLDAVRDAFGYAQLDVYGISYGTRVAQHYARRFPTQTRTVVLDGVVPVDLPLGPDIAPDAQRALDQIFARCIEDTECYVAFGDLAQKFDALMTRTAEAPVDITLIDPISAERIDTAFGRGELMMAVRLMSYSPETAALLPYMIDQAYRENYQPLAAQALLNSENLSDMLAMGMHNSVACTEDVPFFEDTAIDTEALASAYMGDLAYEGLRETCTVWPTGPIDSDFKEPFSSPVPTLIMSGETDPVTPPRNGDRAAAYLGNAHTITLAGQGHGQVQIGCMPQLLARFVQLGTFDTLDETCLDVQQPAPFFVSPSGPTP